MKLTIEDDEGRRTQVPLDRDEIIIGRQEGCAIRLPERNVSRRHARLLRADDGLFIEDLDSYTGTFVNDHRIHGKKLLADGDRITIGDYRLAVEGLSQGESTHPNARIPEGATHPGWEPPPGLDPAPPAPTEVDHEAATLPPYHSPDFGDAFSVDSVPGLSPEFQAAETATAMPPLDSARELRMSERPRLVCLSPPFTGVSFELTHSVVPFGRSEEVCELVIDHNSISRSHGWFQYENNTWDIHDNDSANGVKVNGNEVKHSPVKFGDMLDLGHLRFRFCSPDDMFVFSPVDLGDGEQKKSSVGLYVALVLFAVLAGAVGAYVFTNMNASRSTRGALPLVDGEQRMCDLGRVALAELRWEEAIQQLTVARELEEECPDLEPNLAKAQLERDARVAVDDAEFAESDRKYHQAVELLRKVPSSSRYATEARLRLETVRASGIRYFQGLASRHIDQGRFDEARAAIDELARLQPDHHSLSQLRQRLESARQAQKTARVSAGAREDRASGDTAASPASAAIESTPLKERQEIAKARIREAARLIGTKDYHGAIEVLKEALAQKPGPPYVASIYKALGVSHASLQQTADAARYYDLYLKARPNAPERAEIEAMLQRYYESRKQ